MRKFKDEGLLNDALEEKFKKILLKKRKIPGYF